MDFMHGRLLEFQAILGCDNINFRYLGFYLMSLQPPLITIQALLARRR